MPRRDSKNGVGHKGFTVEVDHTMTIEEAASRRDFTINSMSIDSNGDIIDPFDGMSDLRLKMLRPTSEAFVDDPLRVLRGFQFSARFSMVPSAKLHIYANEISNEYSTLPKERIWEEWKKWALKGKDYLKSLKYLYYTGWMKHYPEIDKMYFVPQSPKWHPEGNVGIHTGHVLDHMDTICERENITGDNRLVMIFAALCHDFGKATHTQINGDKITAHGHEQASGPLARSFLESIGCPEFIIERVIPLVVNHMVNQVLSDKAIRRLSVRLGKATIRELCFVVEADHCGRPPLPKKLSDSVIHLIYQAYKLGILDGKPIREIKGEDLIRLGFMPGPNFGKTLKKLYEMQLSGTNITDKIITQVYKNLENSN